MHGIYFYICALILNMLRTVFTLLLLLYTCCAYSQYITDTLAIPQPDTSAQAVQQPIVTSADTAVTATAKALFPGKAKDTVQKKFAFEPNPKKSGLYSAILPGMGQLYNRQYWKLPVVYAACGAAGYFIGFNLSNYQKFRKAYVYRIDGDPKTVDDYVDKYPDATNLKQLQDQYRKWLDLTVLLSALGYSLQIMDAIVSAHLKNFDVSRDISLNMRPVLQPNYIGFGLVMNIK
jgi:hypothetical protein